MDRRHFLSVCGTSAYSIFRPYLNPSQTETPPVADRTSGDWDLAFEDTFENPGLGTEWGIGWGWGRRTSSSPTVITTENITTSESHLNLTGTHREGTIHSGAVNTRDEVTFGPGSYLEARIKFADRPGFLNAFWSKPNSETWPPEIDVVELWQENGSPDATSFSRHHLHYSRSTTPGDDMTYHDDGFHYQPGGDLTESFHTYGVEWQPNRIVHFVDGQPIQEWTNPRLLAAMGAGAPFYMMFSLDINRIGEADMSIPWGEAMVIDWVRLWQYHLERPAEDTHYLWIRSTDDELATFTFRATGGNIELDVHQNNPGYWIAPDRFSAGGAVTRSESLPGFWYDGEIINFNYGGSPEVFIDDVPINPEQLIRESDSSSSTM